MTITLDSIVSRESLSWAYDQIEAAMKQRKERFLTIVAHPDQLLATQRAALLIAWRKRTAIERSSQGESSTAFNWVNQDPDLAGASAVLAKHIIDATDISLLPIEFLTQSRNNEEPVHQDPYTMDLFAGMS